MACFSVPNIKITGIAAAVPENVVSNRAYDRISEKDRKLLIKATGIEERRVAPDDLCATDMCVAAAEKLLAQLAWDRSEIQALIFVTQTPDYQMPGSSMILQQRLGLSTACLAFDINQGCAGYVYGLATLSGLMSGGQIKKGLLLVGDTITRTISLEDKSTSPIFADAGTATALEWSEDAPEMTFNLQTDGAGYEAIIIREGGARNKLTEDSLKPEELDSGICRAPNQMAMNGLNVFQFALKSVAPNIRELLEKTGKTTEAYDYFVFHQANMLLNESIRKKLKLDKEKVPYTLQKYGNTSCATIPLTIVSELSKEITSRNIALVLSGFGVGLSWGSATITLDQIACPALIEM